MSYPIDIDQDIMDAAVNFLQQDPKQVDTKCMICVATNPTNADHQFSICPVLKDHEFLKTAYINLMQLNKQLHQRLYEALNLLFSHHHQKIRR